MTNVLFGLAGIAVGAILSYFVARRSADAERQAVSRSNQITGLQALLAEIRLNQVIAKTPQTTTTNTLTRFTFEAWQVHKHHVEGLSQCTQDSVREGYSKLLKVNNLVVSPDDFAG